MFPTCEVGTDAKVVALYRREAVGDGFPVEIASAQSNVMTRALEVLVPPVKIHQDAVVEDVQVVTAELAPLHTRRWGRESLVEM